MILDNHAVKFLLSHSNDNLDWRSALIELGNNLDLSNVSANQFDRDV